jgi:protein phosphatase
VVVAIPELALVVLIGPSGSGKSTFARRHFKTTEVLSSDACRALVSDSENEQCATTDAFAVLHFIAARRLAAGKLTVVDATNVQEESRQPLIQLARQYHCIPVAIVFDLPERLCQERNAARPDRAFGPHVIRQHRQQLRRSLRTLKPEGFRHVYVFESPEGVDAATVERQPLWNNRRDERGPFDIIGDVHGCFDELAQLLVLLGYAPTGPAGAWSHPQQRKLVFVGDLVDRGPQIPEVVRLVIDSVRDGSALCVPGNHDIKFMRAVWGKNVQIAHGLAESLSQFATYEGHYRGFSRVAAEFFDGLVSHYVLDGGRLVVAHAGMKAELQGRGSRAVRDFALYGETTGETDEFGLPVRHNWAAEYRGRAAVVYGHTPVPEAEWLNHTINIDTGCVFGGKLTALRWPERELVSVPARRVYAQPARPFIVTPPGAADVSDPGDGGKDSRGSASENGLSRERERSDRPLQHAHDDVLDIADLLGKRIIQTRLVGNITIREEHGIAALEVLSRFAANPKWLIYLPPTMSPCETSRQPDLLEHPAEAFAYFRHAGVPRVICEEKHMGSRAVVIVCRDAAAARRRFGIDSDEIGICYTRTGRQFFDDPGLEAQLLARVRDAATRAGLWDELKTAWICLDGELMPWSAKAQQLLRQQYAAAGAAARAGLAHAVKSLTLARKAGAPVEELLQRYVRRAELCAQFVAAYRRYCWEVAALDDMKLAPFHVLASDSGVHINRDHVWHMDTLARLCAADADNGARLLLATPYRMVDVTDDSSTADGVRWWEERTDRGGEGMVVKPLEFVTKGPRGLVQPAIKVRGREYLRIIYGPEYTEPAHLERLRTRGLGGKRSLALREFALGIEGLERFVRREPLRRVHECVFGALALESEPVDPRL